MVPVIKKNRKIRICVDLERLNENVKREKFILPTLDDILPKLAKSTVFSSLDAESGFWQIPLEENSARLTTFITPLGSYCFKRYLLESHQHLKSSNEKYQSCCTDMRGQLYTYGWHFSFWINTGNTWWVMETIQASSLRPNKDECQLSQPELSFLR